MSFNTDKFIADLINVFAFGIVGIILTVIGYKVFDWMTPRIDVEKELSEKQNVAVAIVVAGLIIGICIVVAQTIHHP